MQINMEVNLKDLSNETLCELTKASVNILKERSEIPGKVAQIKPVEEKPEEKKHKRGPYKKHRKKPTRNFTELDKIVVEYHGKKSYKEMIEIAAEKGITANDKQIDYRRRTLGLSTKKKKARPKKTNDEYLKSIEERDNLNLKGTENPKTLDEAEDD